MPVLIIAVVFLVLFLIMGAMSISAVISERRFEREVEDYKIITGVPPADKAETNPAAKIAGAGR
jgi:Na+-transporting methylmalonyl-CoA/oxaloacetate decarboxylase gamma subunit